MWLVVLLAVVASAPTAAWATEDGDRAAWDHYRAGRAAFADKAFSVAGVAFDAAFAQTAHPALRHNAALAYLAAGHQGVAKHRLQAFEAMTGARAAERRWAREKLQTLVGVASVETLPSETLATAQRQLRERLRGLKPAPTSGEIGAFAYLTADGEVAGGDGVRPPLGTFGWIGVGLGAAVTVIGVVLKVDAGNIVDDLTPDRRPDGIVASPTQRQAHALAEEATRQDNAATVALVAGGSLLAVGITLLVVDVVTAPDDDETAADEQPSVMIHAAPTGAGVVVGGRF